VLVAGNGFGSLWRHRSGEETHEGGRFDQPVYYRTTGIVVNGNVRQRPRVCGYARFDAIGGFDPNRLSRMMHGVFECEEPPAWMGRNKLLFKRLLKLGESPDSFLVFARSELTGQLPVGTEGWRSGDTWLLSFSECSGQQEGHVVDGPPWSDPNRALADSYSNPQSREFWVAQLALSNGK
jgi:hypothetical protein